MSLPFVSVVSPQTERQGDVGATRSVFEQTIRTRKRQMKRGSTESCMVDNSYEAIVAVPQGITIIIASSINQTRKYLYNLDQQEWRRRVNCFLGCPEESDGRKNKIDINEKFTYPRIATRSNHSVSHAVMIIKKMHGVHSIRSRLLDLTGHQCSSRVVDHSP